jgi:hypothetical protein
VIDHQIEDGSGLEEVSLAGAPAAAGSDAIYQIGLDAERFGKNSDDKAGLTVFYRSQDDAPGFMQLHYF